MLLMPTKSVGFEQIIDFLNAHPIKYALAVNPTIYTSCIEQFWAIPKAKNVNGEAYIHTKVDGKKVIISEATIRRDLKLKMKEELISYQMKSSLNNLNSWDGRKGFFWKGNTFQAQADIDSTMISAPQHTQTIIQPSTSKPQKKQKPRNPNRHDTQETQPSGPITNVEEEALNQDNVSQYSNDPSLSDQVSVAKTIVAKDLTIDDITLAKALEALNTSKPKIRGIIVRDHKDQSESTTIPTLIANSIRPKAKGIVMEEPSEETTTTIPIPSKDQDKGKGIMVEEPLKMKKKDQISFDEQEARRLQVELDQEQRLAEKEAQKALEANIAVIEQWHDVQAKIKADFELAKRLQAKEHEQLTNDEKAKLFREFLENRRKFFTAKRDEEKRNRPPTKAQQRCLMCTYLKNMDGWKPQALKNKSFVMIKDFFDKAITRINKFVYFITELLEEISKKAKESSSKRAGDELEQESAKKQKIDDDQEGAKLKRCLEIVLDDEDDVTIDATPLSFKSPAIIDYKIYKEGRKSYFQIIRADGSSQMYYTFSKMLKNFNREDLEVLWSIVKARFKKVQPVDDMDCYLLHTLKSMFEHHVEDSVWKNQQGLAKMYLLTNYILTQMWIDVRLQVDYEVEMAYDLLRLKLRDSEDEHQVYRRIVGIKSLHEVTVVDSQD
nr:hypothetical protein [Tanacetum cinerariifolium]